MFREKDLVRECLRKEKLQEDWIQENGWSMLRAGPKPKDKEKASGVGGRAGSRARKKTLHDKKRRLQERNVEEVRRKMITTIDENEKYD